MGRVFYVTREEVMDAFDTREAAYRSAQIDSAIGSASDDIDGWLNRHKHGLVPRIATRYFDFPDRGYSQAWRLWLDENEIVSVTSLTAGSVLLTPSQYFLEPVNSGPPYTYIEVNLSTTAGFGNNNTWQRAIAVAGVWGINNDQEAAGTLNGAVNSAVTSLNVSDASLVGVGSVLTVDSEQMNVTGRSPLTTGVNLGTALTAQKNNTTIAGISVGYSVGEILLIDSERMRIVDNNGTNLTVIRAYDGSVLAAHNIGATLFAFRTLTVERGAQGTTAASHSSGPRVRRGDAPWGGRAPGKGGPPPRGERVPPAWGARVYPEGPGRPPPGTGVAAGRGRTARGRPSPRRYKRKFRKRAV